MKETINKRIKETILTAEEWFETKNVGIFTRPSFINRPPGSCPVVYDYGKNEYKVYSLISFFKSQTL